MSTKEKVLDRKSRLEKLRELINRAPDLTQIELVDKMSLAGFHVTQASVSRDIKTLGLQKRDGVYMKDTPFSPILRKSVKSCEMAGENLVVVKTIPGAANYIAEWVDEEIREGIVGTVAGDNTFFVAVKTKKSGQNIIKKLSSFL